MFSGTTLRHNSGNYVGAHQKIDKIARRHLKALIKDEKKFPIITDILHFEGNNGPDGVKRRSPGKDEPWHHYNPTDDQDTSITTIISDHEHNLVQALKENNYERASFEAAWLAHAIVDGLTPAHHYPLEEKIEELWGVPRNERLTVRQKNIVPGKTYRESFSKNWQYWGAKGVWTTHYMFEWGFSALIATQKGEAAQLTQGELSEANKIGTVEYFKNTAQKIYDMNMYETYYKQGWTPKLAKMGREELFPLLVKAVCISWYNAAVKAGFKQSDAT